MLIVLIILLLLTAKLGDKTIFLVAFVSGLFLDLLQLRPLGQTSLFLTIFVFIVLLYERKFQIRTLPFVFISAFLGSFAYLSIFGGSQIFLTALITASLSAVTFKAITIWKKASEG